MSQDHLKNMNFLQHHAPKQGDGWVILKVANSFSFKFLNNLKLWLFIWPDIIIILMLTGFTLAQVSNIVLELTPFAQEILIVTIGPLFTNFLKAILPLKVIESLIFWRLNDALPGHRAFTKYITHSRIDTIALKK